MMDSEDESRLEEHLLQHYSGALSQDEEAERVSVEHENQHALPSLNIKKPTRPLRPLREEIHFLADEIQEHLDREIERIVFSLQHPLAGKNVWILMEMTRHLIHARAQQRHREQEPVKVKKEAKPALQATMVHLPLAPPQPLPVPPLPLSPFRVPIPLEVAGGPVFPELPVADHYELSALDQEHISKDELGGEEKKVTVVHIPLVYDDERQAIVAYADFDEQEGIYRMSEPPLDETQKKLLAELKHEITDVTMLKNVRALQKIITKMAKRLKMTTDDEDYFTLKYYLVRDLAYAGTVTPLLNDQKITHILCEGPGIPLMIVREGKKIPTDVTFKGKDELNAFLKHLAKKTFQTVTVEEPVLDAVYQQFRIRGTLGTDMVPSRFLMTKVEV